MSTFREITRKVGEDLGGKALWTLEELIAQTSTVPNTPYLESDLFEWTKYLEHNYAEIRDELDEQLVHSGKTSILQHKFYDQKNITKKKKCRIYSLLGLANKTSSQDLSELCFKEEVA